MGSEQKRGKEEDCMSRRQPQKGANRGPHVQKTMASDKGKANGGSTP